MIIDNGSYDDAMLQSFYLLYRVDMLILYPMNHLHVYSYKYWRLKELSGRIPIEL